MRQARRVPVDHFHPPPWPLQPAQAGIWPRSRVPVAGSPIGPQDSLSSPCAHLFPAGLSAFQKGLSPESQASAGKGVKPGTVSVSGSEATAILPSCPLELPPC